MDYFKKLPGFTKAPSGQEWALFKKIPRIFFIGTVILAAAIVYLYYFSAMPKPEQQKLIYLCLGLLFTHWFFVGTVAIGCIVVMIMKGPAYVADPYELPKENKSLENPDS